MSSAATSLFVLALLGHLVGDYLLQTKQMALGKSARGWRGAATCTSHVAIYTLSVCAFMRSASPLVAAAVFAPHYIIDRYSLAAHWLRLMRGRTFEGAGDQWDVAFTALVYAVADNTLHLLCLLAVVTLLEV